MNAAINKKFSKISSVAEDLINNATCAVKCELQTFKILRQYLNNFNLVRLEAILIHLKKPKLLKITNVFTPLHY